MLFFYHAFFITIPIKCEDLGMRSALHLWEWKTHSVIPVEIIHESNWLQVSFLLQYVHEADPSMPGINEDGAVNLEMGDLGFLGAASELNEDVSQQTFTGHVPGYSRTRRTCKYCYAVYKVQRKVPTYCIAPNCRVFLHCTQNKNCFDKWHRMSSSWTVI